MRNSTKEEVDFKIGMNLEVVTEEDQISIEAEVEDLMKIEAQHLEEEVVSEDKKGSGKEMRERILEINLTSEKIDLWEEEETSEEILEGILEVIIEVEDL